MNAILSIHAGSGGKESGYWVGVLLKRYGRWAEKNGYRFRVEDIQKGSSDTLKSVLVVIEGAYEAVLGEKGVHRFTRVSPFDSSRRKHTSFVSVDIIPEIERPSVTISSDDLRIDTFRSGGHGGMHRNSSDSAVRVVHIPTGTTVTCESSRSQTENKKEAMRILESRLVARAREETDGKIESLRNDRRDSWGTQIMSYDLCSDRVKDHRTGKTTSGARKLLGC